MTSHFRDTGHFETSAPNDPKVTLNPTRSNYPIYVTSVHDSQILAETSAPNDPKLTLKPTMSNHPILYNNCPRVSNFGPFCTTTSHFGVTGHFETHAPIDLKMTLNTTRSKVHHICVTSVPESQILFRFALRPAVSMI